MTSKSHILILLFLFVSCIGIDAQNIVRYKDNIRTLTVEVNGEWDKPNVMLLNGEDFVRISFDDLKHEYTRYSYTLKHCDANWEVSDLLESEYMDGFNNNLIEGYEQSFNTKMEYNHYQINIPNEDVKLLLPGNYCVEIFDEDEEELAAKCYFSVLEPRVVISAEVLGNTDVDTYKSHQQIDFTINLLNYNIRNPHEELKVVVTQNNRWDNAAVNIKPTYIQHNKLLYTHNRNLIFDAGNEFRRFEILDEYVPTMNVDKVEYIAPHYHATLFTDEQRINYIFDKDQNGKFWIRNSKNELNETESEYFFTHFSIDMPQLQNGDLYVCGDLTDNTFTESNKMEYDLLNHSYTSTLLLKQGSYNYQYLYVPKGETRGYTLDAEGDFHQTENVYNIYVYHKPFGERYDKLVGFHTVSNVVE